MNKEMLDLIRKTSPEMIAHDILSVQPIPSDAFAKLQKAAMSESDLKNQGYKPVSSMELLWVKKNED